MDDFRRAGLKDLAELDTIRQIQNRSVTHGVLSLEMPCLFCHAHLQMPPQSGGGENPLSLRSGTAIGPCTTPAAPATAGAFLPPRSGLGAARKSGLLPAPCSADGL